MPFIFNTIAVLSTIFTITISGYFFHCFCVSTGREHRNSSQELNDFDIANVRGMIILAIIVVLYILTLCALSRWTTIDFGKYLIRFLLSIIEMFLFIHIGTHGTLDDAMGALAIKIALLLIVICTAIVLINSIQLTVMDFFISIIFSVTATLVNSAILPLRFVLLVFDIPDLIRKKVKKYKKEMRNYD